MVTTVIGRDDEKRALNKLVESKKAQFLAVWGRRRVGKTYLIEQSFQTKDTLYFCITGLRKGSLKKQLTLFTNKYKETFFADLALQLKEPTSWLAAFELLTNTINKQAGQKKIVLFFDELPWLAQKRSGFLNALDHYWNTAWSKNNKMIVVVCGSAASWMIKHVINDKGGLHNRVTAQLPLHPFTLKETQAYLASISAQFNQQQIVELYMAIGGIPHYLEKIDPALSVSQNISKLCLSRGGELINEFDKLFNSLFDNASAYIELINVIAQKQSGLTRTELTSKIKLTASGGTLSERLQALEEAGFIRSFIPAGKLEKGIYYRAIDEYCLFYLTWIKPVKRQIEHEVNPSYWQSKHQSPAWRSWSGYAFESVCLKHVAQIRKALFIPDGSLSNSWKVQPNEKGVTDGAQIDLLFDRDDGVVTICEIKYNQQPFQINKQYAKNLQHKMDAFKQATKLNKQIYLSMVTLAPLKKNLYSEELVRSKATVEDLFE